MRAYSLIMLLTMPVSAERYRQVHDIGDAVSKTIIQRIDDMAFIPVDEGNRDYIAFLEWQKEGGRIQPPPEPQPPDPRIEETKQIILNESKTEKERLEALITYLGVK